MAYTHSIAYQHESVTLRSFVIVCMYYWAAMSDCYEYVMLCSRFFMKVFHSSDHSVNKLVFHVTLYLTQSEQQDHFPMLGCAHTSRFIVHTLSVRYQLRVYTEKDNQSLDTDPLYIM